MNRSLSALLLPLCLFACGDDAPANQGTETVTLVFTSASLLGDSVVDEASVRDLTFMEDVKAHLGRDLEGLELTSIKLSVVGTPGGLNGWSDLFEPPFRLYFETDHGDQFRVTNTTAPAGFGTWTLPIEVTRAELSASEDMRKGRFTVRVESKGGRNPGDLFGLNTEVIMTFMGY